MSLLNQIYATPSRVKGVIQLFAYLGGQRLKRSTVEDLLSPPSLAPNRGGERLMIAAVLDECIGLGLVVESADRGGETEPAAARDGDGSKMERRQKRELYLSLDPQLRDAFASPADVPHRLPAVILERVLGPNGDQDLSYALAWYLTQDVLGAPGTWKTFGDRLVEQGLRDMMRFNDNKYQMLSYWAPYLGFASNYALVGQGSSTDDRGGVEERMAPDPTQCLRRILASILPPDGRRIRLVECMEAVAASCPLFESGDIRKEMESYAAPRPLRHLSSTTSHALLRLVDERTIDLELRSDADGLILVEGKSSRAFSEIGRPRAMESVA
jgi:hypothetical protein